MRRSSTLIIVVSWLGTVSCVCKPFNFTVGSADRTEQDAWQLKQRNFNLRVPKVFDVPNRIEGATRYQLLTDRRDAQFDFAMVELVQRDVFHIIADRDSALTSGPVLDIGADVGIGLLLLGMMHPDIHMYAFEPSPMVFRFLVWNIMRMKMEDRVQAFQCGVTVDGRTVQHCGSFRTSFICSPGSIPVDVPTVRLQDIVDKWGISHTPILKLDDPDCEAELIPELHRLVKTNKFSYSQMIGEVYRTGMSNETKTLFHTTICGDQNNFVTGCGRLQQELNPHTLSRKWVRPQLDGEDRIIISTLKRRARVFATTGKTVQLRQGGSVGGGWLAGVVALSVAFLLGVLAHRAHVGT
eukprot:TRINITY_DN114424_c0_g1_i1.p1 TRINITY_DN114424_c0_g1~~TRINITY_DN114424_c0_g1_i1.p1  ORF type:complete len:353 (-),score=9.07 TRINITY_DN114424_c0_g1_i1:55-1113(-)